MSARLSDSVDRLKKLLQSLIADRLGHERVAELLNDTSIRIFDSYLLKDPESIPRKEDYNPPLYTQAGGPDHFRPDGWAQISITAIEKDPDFAEFLDWPVAYHGTDSNKLGPTLESGLRKPGELPSVQIAHVQIAHGQTGTEVEGAIWVTPSLWLASHPVYASVLELAKGHWVQFVFKVRVRPGSYKAKRCMLSNQKHWDSGLQIDPNFEHNQALEWVIADSSNVMVVGLMIRELGALANHAVFGGVVGALRSFKFGSHDVQHCWVSNLKGALRDGGYFIDAGELFQGQRVIEWSMPDLQRKKELYGDGQAISSEHFEMPFVGLYDMHLSWYPNGCDSIGCENILLLYCQCNNPIWIEAILGCTSNHVMCVDNKTQGSWSFSFPNTELEIAAEANDSISFALHVRPMKITPESSSMTIDQKHVCWQLDDRLMHLGKVAVDNFATIFSPVAEMQVGEAIVSFYLSFCPSCWWQDCCCMCVTIEACKLRDASVPGSEIQHENFKDSELSSMVMTYEIAIAFKKVQFKRLMNETHSAMLWNRWRHAVHKGKVCLHFTIIDIAHMHEQKAAGEASTLSPDSQQVTRPSVARRPGQRLQGTPPRRGRSPGAAASSR